MRPLAAWLTILGSLVVGILAGNLLMRSTGGILEVGVSCLILAEAEKAGHLDAAKRSALVDRVVQSPMLNPKDKADAAKLKTGCPRF